MRAGLLGMGDDFQICFAATTRWDGWMDGQRGRLCKVQCMFLEIDDGWFNFVRVCLFAYFHGVLSAYTKYEVTFVSSLDSVMHIPWNLAEKRGVKAALSCLRLQGYVTVPFSSWFFSCAGPIRRDPGLHVFSGKCHQTDSMSLLRHGTASHPIIFLLLRYMPCLLHSLDRKLLSIDFSFASMKDWKISKMSRGKRGDALYSFFRHRKMSSIMKPPPHLPQVSPAALSHSLPRNIPQKTPHFDLGRKVWEDGK